jgi:hypothetical protein
MKIISENEYSKLFETERISLLLHEIWQGEGVRQCDGDIGDISILTYLVKQRIRRIKGMKVSPKQIIGLNFSPKIQTEKYWYQYKFRHSSI